MVIYNNLYATHAAATHTAPRKALPRESVKWTRNPFDSSFRGVFCFFKLKMLEILTKSVLNPSICHKKHKKIGNISKFSLNLF